MSLLPRLCFVLAAVALMCNAIPRLAFACQPPQALMDVESTVPADGAAGVGTAPTLVAHLSVEQSYDFEKFRADTDLPFEITVSDVEGNEVVSATVVPEPVFDTSNDRQVIRFEPGELELETTYRVTLARDGKIRDWTFSTGDGATDPQMAPAPLEIDLDAYFADRPVTRCCPIEFPGQCPVCSDVGTEPLATVDAGFRLVPHPAGPAAFVYTLQSRNRHPEAEWSDVTSATFEDAGSFRSMQLSDDRLQAVNTCVRVVARSVIAPFDTYHSNEECREPADFADPPESVIDESRLTCGEEVDDEVDELGGEVDDGGEADGGGEDADVDGSEDGGPNGWEFTEDGMGTDAGCGCSSANRSTIPGSFVLVLFLAMVGRVVREKKKRSQAFL